MKLDSLQKGLGFAFLAPLLYTTKAVIIKGMAPLQLELVVFFRFFFDFLFLLPFFVIYRQRLYTKNLSLHFWRGLLAMLAIYCSVYGLQHLKLVNVALLENTFPLFVPLVTWTWYRQKVSSYSWCLLLLGFFSIFFILGSKFDILYLASLASLGSAFFSAIIAVAIHTLSKTNHPLAILFYFNLFGGGLSLIPLLFTWRGTSELPTFWWPLLLISFTGVLYQYAMNRAFSLLSPHVAGNFTYFSVLFSAVLGWLIWDEVLTMMQICGGILLVGVGVMVRLHARFESQRQPESHKKPQNPSFD